MTVGPFEAFLPFFSFLPLGEAPVLALAPLGDRKCGCSERDPPCKLTHRLEHREMPSGEARRKRGPEGNAIPPAGECCMREFASQFKESFRVLWLIAVGIVGDRSSADDIVQDAALIAFKKQDEFTPGTNFTAWLGQIVRNVARNRARLEQNRRTAALDDIVLARASIPSDSSAGQTRLAEGARFDADPAALDHRIAQALSTVNETARACLLLRTIGEMDYARIAELLGIPEGTAMSHVHRTRRYLRERLTELAPTPSNRPEEEP